VIPDDPITTCHHCYTLQHYLLNTTKYFTSNTQLLFLPEIHHLHTDLIIQNVHNFSLIGNTNNATQDVVIHCDELVGAIFVNISNLAVRSITMEGCKVHEKYVGNRFYLVSLLIKDCEFVIVYQLKLVSKYQEFYYYLI